MSTFPVVDSTIINRIHQRDLGLIQLSRSEIEAGQIIATKANASKGFWGIAKALLPAGSKDAEISALVKQLQELNPETTSTKIALGQKIKIPAQENANSTPAEKGSWAKHVLTMPHVSSDGMMVPVAPGTATAPAEAKIKLPWRALETELKVVEIRIAQGNSTPELLSRRDELRAEIATRTTETKAASKVDKSLPLEVQWKDLMIEHNLLSVQLEDLKTVQATPEALELFDQLRARLVELAVEVRDVNEEMQKAKAQMAQRRVIGS